MDRSYNDEGNRRPMRVREEYITRLETERARLAEAMRELLELMQEYAPAWYTQKHHDKATSALGLLSTNESSPAYDPFMDRHGDATLSS